MARSDINATLIRTKSGTNVIVKGRFDPADKKERIKYGDRFVDIYNRDFSENEQRHIGNVLYELYRTHHIRRDFAAHSTYHTGQHARQHNPGHKRLAEIYIRPQYRNRESTVVHELVHARRYSMGGRHNEKKIDFETVGRVSRKGLQDAHGYYSCRDSYPKHSEINNRELSHRQLTHAFLNNIKHDRRLLTGSLSHSMTGKRLTHRVERLFPQSAFFKGDVQW